MDHFERIYAGRAAEYHEMIRAEDVDGNLPAALHRIVSFSGRRVVDLGSGTGRIPLLVGGDAAQIIGVDLNFPMLAEHRFVREKAGGSWPLVNADNRRLPFRDGAADIVTAGWAIGHLRGWYPNDWKAQIRRILDEMARIAAPGGTMIIMETMTTGGFAPAPPNAELAEYFRWLEDEWGCTRSVIQTDYQFESVEEAVARTTFFFGEEMAARIREQGWARLPEWTGIWHRIKKGG